MKVIIITLTVLFGSMISSITVAQEKSMRLYGFYDGLRQTILRLHEENNILEVTVIVLTHPDDIAIFAYSARQYCRQENVLCIIVGLTEAGQGACFNENTNAQKLMTLYIKPNLVQTG